MSVYLEPERRRLQQSYDRIAADYAAAAGERGFLEHTLEYLQGCLPANARVLDLGCGPGRESIRLCALGWQAVGVDLSWGMLQIAAGAGRADWVQADMCYLPFAPGFDAILAVASLLHVPRRQWPALLAQLARLLKPDGRLYLSVKAGQGEAWTTFSYGQAEPRFFVYWQPAELDALLTDHGFDVIAGDALESPPSEAWINRLCQKRALAD